MRERATATGGVRRRRAPSIEDWLRRVLDGPTVVGSARLNDLAREQGRRVLEVADRDGRRHFCKVEPRTDAWRSEVRAYRRWLPALGDLAAPLAGAHRGLGAVLTGAVPGAVPTGTREEHQRQAGAWLRRLHDAAPAREGRGQERSGRLVHRLVRGAPDLVTARELAFVEEQVGVAEGERGAPEVPSHGDFRVYNWLVDDEGVLRVIDFGDARWAAPTLDLAGLAFGPWWGAPHLRQAFLDGYGRSLTDAEEAVVTARMCLRAVRNIVVGSDRGAAAKVARGRRCLEVLMADA
jgi:hypothetical protein